MQLDPEFGSVEHRLWQASSAAELIQEARQRVDTLHEPLTRALQRLQPGGHVAQHCFGVTPIHWRAMRRRAAPNRLRLPSAPTTPTP